MLHLWNIYQHLPHKSPSFVGKYTIHGSYGISIYIYVHALLHWCSNGHNIVKHVEGSPSQSFMEVVSVLCIWRLHKVMLVQECHKPAIWIDGLQFIVYTCLYHTFMVDLGMVYLLRYPHKRVFWSDCKMKIWSENLEKMRIKLTERGMFDLTTVKAYEEWGDWCMRYSQSWKELFCRDKA